MTPAVKVILLGALVASFPGEPARGQAIYRDSEGRFSVSLPRGWGQVPDSVLQDFDRRAGTSATFVAAFYRTSAPAWFEYPYAMLQVQAGVPVDPESLAAALTSYQPETTQTRGVASQPRMFAARYDRAQDLVRWMGEGALTDGRALRWYAGFRAASFGVVGIFVYGLAADSLTTAAALDSLGAGLAIEPAHRYQRGQAAAGGGAPARTGLLGLLGGLTFVALAGVLLAALWFVGRHGPASRHARV